MRERVEASADPGIKPIPRAERKLSASDMAVLWGDLGVGLLVLVTAGFLVPSLGFGAALTAIVLGSVIGSALLALAGAAGARHGVPTMVLFRPVLGLRGSWIPSALNLIQLIGWTAVELWAMALVAGLVTERVFGFSARGLWLVAVTAICGALALWGPVGVTRVWMKRFGAWVIGGICLIVSVLIVLSGGLADAFEVPATGGTFGAGLDLVIAMPISWLPLVADYNRYASGARPAFTGTFWGYLIANVWLYTLGALLILSQSATPDPAGIAAGILSVAGGSIAGILFIVGLLVGETDEAFADIYSGAVSVQNVWPRASQRVLAAGITLVAAALAARLTMDRYEAFLFLIGSVFIPLFGILAADHFVNRRGEIEIDELYAKKGRYWFNGGVRVRSLGAWIAGFIVYHWIVPVGPEWWTNVTAAIPGGGLVISAGWLGASIPSFLIAFVLTLEPSAIKGKVPAAQRS